MNDIEVWNDLFKDENEVGERDFSNFIKDFNMFLNNNNRHIIMMSIIETIKERK